LSIKIVRNEQEPRTHSNNVYFYVNGIPRLVMACVIAAEAYPDARKHLILLHQHDYRYDEILPAISGEFESIFPLHVPTRKYSHWRQFIDVYLGPHTELQDAFEPGSDVVLFDISSPLQKFIVRHNRSLGNRVTIYAESLVVDRCFLEPDASEWGRRIARAVFPRAYAYQHDYEVFYVLNPSIYATSPHATKLKSLAPLYRAASFSRYARLLTAHMPLDDLEGYELVFFGQPLSDRDKLVTRRKEQQMLADIFAGRRTLVLPHPREILGDGDKYSALRNATVFRSGLPNELLLLRLRPKSTATFASTIGIAYAATNPDSANEFYPPDERRLRMVRGNAAALANVRIDARFAQNNLNA